MALVVSDPRCSGCGKKLCTRIELHKGAVAFECPRCGKHVEFREGMPKAGATTE